jgi:four helix bundle protein
METGIANMEKGKITDVEDMPVYQAFFGLALEVERITNDCKSEFRWLRGQALRSSESVCANMAEGFFS